MKDTWMGMQEKEPASALRVGSSSHQKKLWSNMLMLFTWKRKTLGVLFVIHHLVGSQL